MSKKNMGGDLGFNGQDNTDKLGGYSKKYQTNASGRMAKENYGRGPTKAGVTGKTAGPSTAAGAGVTGHGTQVKCPANQDKQNVGRGPTKGNS